MWKEIDSAKEPLMSFSGAFPKKLYRYRSVNTEDEKLESLVDFEIINEAVYLAGFKELNDPDEGRFLIKFKGSYSDIKEYWKSALMSTKPQLSESEIDRESKARTDEVVNSGRKVPIHVIEYTRYVLEHVLRVACFTTQPVNYSMWANYAKCFQPIKKPIDHAGLCIEYSCDEGWRPLNLHPVHYTDDIPEINVVTRNEAELTKAVYTKSKEWRCEDEWRIFSIIQSMPPFPENLTANSKMKIEGGVSCVIFGINTPDRVIEKVKSMVKESNRSIPFKKVIRDPRTFERKLEQLL